MTSIAVFLAVLISPYVQQARAIAELKRQNVFVYCECDDPIGRKVLGWNSMLGRPLGVQVLLQPDGDKTVRVLGKVVAVAELHQTLLEFRERIKAKFGFDTFPLVVGEQRFPESVMSEIYRQQIRSGGNFYHLTPCGITNFRDIAPEAMRK